MGISILPEKMLDKTINKAFTKAMQKATTPEQKQKLMDMRKEMLSLDKKAKKLKLKTLIKNAPQKDIAAAEMKLKAELKKTGKIQESVLVENPDTNGDGYIDYGEYSSQKSGLTLGDVDAINADKAYLQTDNDNLRNSLSNARTWGLIATIVGSLLFAALVVSIAYNIKMNAEY